MTKKVVIAVCRDYYNYEEAKSYIDDMIINIRTDNEIVILSGGANGAAITFWCLKTSEKTLCLT